MIHDFSEYEISDEPLNALTRYIYSKVLRDDMPDMFVVSDSNSLLPRGEKLLCYTSDRDRRVAAANRRYFGLKGCMKHLGYMLDGVLIALVDASSSQPIEDVTDYRLPYQVLKNAVYVAACCVSKGNVHQAFPLWSCYCFSQDDHFPVEADDLRLIVGIDVDICFDSAKVGETEYKLHGYIFNSVVYIKPQEDAGLAYEATREFCEHDYNPWGDDVSDDEALLYDAYN